MNLPAETHIQTSGATIRKFRIVRDARDRQLEH